MRKVVRIAGIVLAFLAVAWSAVGVMTFLGSQLAGDWKLVFQNSNSQRSAWTLSLLCGAAVAAIVWLFHYESRLTSRRLGLSLLFLRLLLILILFLTLLQPVWTWSFDQTRTGRVVLALDVSESMDTVDAQATEAEKLRAAQALGMLGGDNDAQRTKAWIESLEAGQEPEWITPAEMADPDRRERMARARRENVQSTLREASSYTRLELARRAVTQNPGSLLERLRKLVVLNLSAFAKDQKVLNDAQLDQPIDPKTLNVNRTHSNLTEAADAARPNDAEVPLVGVILLSDGHDTDNSQPARLLSEMQSLHVPVHTVLVGSEHRPRDLSILHIDHPESVFINDQPLVKAIVRTAGFEGQPVKTFLEWMDEPAHPPLEQTITPQGPSSEATFALEKLPVGRHRFRVRTDVIPDETRSDNNSRDFVVSVVDDRAKVLLVDGDARWEFRYLDTALERDDRITLDHVLFDQPFLGVLRRPFLPTRLEEVLVDGSERTPFANYDIVIIGDVSEQQVTNAHWQLLDRYVREEGGTLVLSAGKKFFSSVFHGTIAESLLPLQQVRTIRPNFDQSGPPPQRGFRLFITKDGEQLPMFQLDPDPAESTRIWAGLPGHSWGIIGTAKGAATVWAAALLPGERPVLERERENALIVQQYVGSGQVVWIGIDSTWRWRFRLGDLYHHRFWGQLVRWAVSFKASAGNDVVRLAVREAVIQAGRPAVIQARWEERFLAQHQNLKVQAVVERTGNGERVSQTVSLTPRPGSPLNFEGRAVNLPAGEYSVRLKVDNAADVAKNLPDVMLVVNEELSPERQDVTANRQLLEQIAKQTGGEFLRLNELNRLPDLFKNVTETKSFHEEIPLYGHWLVLVMFCSVAMTEWVLRKINGLP